jgi:hypothetical protein
MELGYMSRKSSWRLSSDSGVALEEVAEQLEHLSEHGCAVRWSDGRWSLTPIGSRLRGIIASPPPSKRAA